MFNVSGFWFLVSGFGLVGIKVAKNAKVAKRFGFCRGLSPWKFVAYFFVSEYNKM